MRQEAERDVVCSDDDRTKVTPDAGDDLGNNLLRHPIQVLVGDPGRRDRRSALVRLPIGVPVLCFSALLNVGAMFAVWGAILATGRIPGWLFAFQERAGRWHTQAAAFLLLLTDARPRVSGAGTDSPVSYSVDRPMTISRRRVIVWNPITSLPHFVVLVGLTIALVPVTVAAWFAIVMTGRHPAPLRQFATGVIRWWARVVGYATSMTDVFPAFSLRRHIGVARPTTTLISASLGLVPVSAVVGLAVLVVGFSGDHEIRHIRYDELWNGTSSSATVHSGVMRLESVDDRADDDMGPFRPNPGNRFVAFTLSIHNTREGGLTVPVDPSSFHLADAHGSTHHPVLLAIDGTPGSAHIPSGGRSIGVVVFELAGDAPPDRLVFDVLDYISKPRRGETVEWVFDEM